MIGHTPRTRELDATMIGVLRKYVETLPDDATLRCYAMMKLMIAVVGPDLNALKAGLGNIMADAHGQPVAIDIQIGDQIDADVINVPDNITRH